MHRGSFQPRNRLRAQQGYILLILALFVALLAFSMLAAAPRVIQQIRRDREEEMIHRGAQYARAIRKFVKKNGVYPTSLDQLENTNHIRYLRRRYKDPFTADGKWRLLHIGDVSFMSAGQTAQGSGQQSGQPTSLLGQPLGGSGTLGQSLGQLGSQLGSLGAQSPGSLGQPAGNATTGSNGILGSHGLASQQTSQPTSAEQSAKAQDDKKDSSGGLSSQPSTQQNLSFGGGAILGVASASQAEGIKEFNGKNKYKDWYFVYNPAAEATSPNGGALIIGPYTGHTFGAGGGGIGTPASQLASPNQPSGFGQPIGSGFGGTSSFGSSPSGSSPAPGSPSPQPGR